MVFQPSEAGQRDGGRSHRAAAVRGDWRPRRGEGEPWVRAWRRSGRACRNPFAVAAVAVAPAVGGLRPRARSSWETHEVYVPDIVGWRRDRVDERPRGRPAFAQTGSARSCRRRRHSSTLGPKHQTFHRCGVPHSWIVVPEHETLTVHRWHQDGYLIVLTAGKKQRIRAEPFDGIERQRVRVQPAWHGDQGVGGADRP
jgi:hypothetical protein